MPSDECPKCGYSGGILWCAPGKFFSVPIRSWTGTRRGGKWICHSVDADSFYKGSGRMHHVVRVIDRLSNSYYERIVEKESGALIREVSEPLTNHQGRGSARRAK